MSAESMTHEQRSQVVDFFMHRLSPEQRETLMATLPVAYNAYVGRQVVTVTTSDGRDMLPETTELDNGRFVKIRKPF